MAPPYSATDTAAPYAFTWSERGRPAAYAPDRAVAYDSAGTSASSAAVNVTVIGGEQRARR